MASKYGPWVATDDWRAYVEITLLSETETTGTFRVKAWLQSDQGSSSNSSNIKGWAGIWDSPTNDYRWSSSVDIGYFSSGSWVSSSSTPFKQQDWTVEKTHSKQTVYGYSYVSANAGIYSGSKSQAEATIELKAKTSYTVTYKANGGSNAPSALTKWHGESLTLSSDTPTRSGYTFVGWNTSSSSTTKNANYDGGKSYTTNANLTLYAVWSKTLSLTYNANGGSNAPAQQSTTIYNSSTSATFTVNSSTTPSRTGYTFLGYSTSSTATTSSYAKGSSITISSNTTLYAVWQINTYAVTYYANKPSGASGSVANLPSNQVKTYGTNLALSKTVPSLNLYNFLGYATSSSATTPNSAYTAANIIQGVTYQTNAALNLYAVWKIKGPTLSIVSAYRSTSTGANSDDGSYATITASWSSETTEYASVTWSCTVGSTTVTAPTSTTSAGTDKSGIVTFIVAANMSTDSQYAVSLSCTDDNGTATVTEVIPSAWYAIDIKNGGHGIAFGKVSSTDYLADFGMAIHTDGDLTVDGSYNLTANDIPSLPASKIGSGTLALARGGLGTSGASAAINTVFAGPSSGSAGNAAFRSLVAADIPSLAASKITSGTLALARGGTASDNSSRSINTVFAGPSSGSAGNASWRKLVAADLPSTSWAYLLGSASATNYARWRSVAGIVMVEVCIASGTNITSSGVSINSTAIASAYRPTREVTAALYHSSNNTGSMWMTTGGILKLNTKASSTQTTGYGVLVYPIA